MNKIFVKILLPLIIAASSCKPAGQSREKGQETIKTTRIEGTLEGGMSKDVILEEMAVREYIPIDTVSCDLQGWFQIDFNPEQTAFYVLRAGGSGYITLLIEPGQKITLNGTYGQSERYSISGSEGSEALMELSAAHKKALNELGEIAKQVREARMLDTYQEIKIILDLKFDSITEAFQSYSKEFIRQNQESLSILIALYNLYGQGLPVFDPVDDFQTYLTVDSLLQVHYPDFEAALLLHTQILEANSAALKNREDIGPGLGEIAPDFVSSRPDGSRLALSDLRGNFVLLGFWAGWSNLSREENPYLREVWDKKGDFPLHILQVSFDGEHEIWTRAIEEDELGWEHVSTLRRWESPVADLYGVEKIPSNFLIDPEGRIIAKDLFGKELLRKFENIYNN